MNERVAIIGGGVSGLAAAWFLEKKGYKDIVLLEASAKAGGKIDTIEEDGFLVETAADSFITTKPEALELVRDLGLEDEIIEPETNRFFICKDGRLLDSPKGLRMMAVVDEAEFRKTGLFSEEGKERILAEKNVPPRRDEGDESFASFVTRRFGEEMLQNYAEPLFGGIYATPADEMSMQSTFPMFLQLEKKYGSLTAAATQSAQEKGSVNRSAFVGLKKGMGSLISTLDAGLKHTRILYNTPVQTIEKTENGYRLILGNGEAMEADKVISALPAPILASLMADINPQAARLLKDFTVSSSLIVTLVYRKDKVKGDIDATGYVSAKGEENIVSASTWTSSKWKDRVPEGYFLARCFMRGVDMKEDAAIEQAHNTLKKVLDIDGGPEKTWVHSWSNALPQYKLGHKERVAKLQESMSKLPGFDLAGAYLSGVGIPDCIRQAKEAVEKLSTRVTA